MVRISFAMLAVCVLVACNLDKEPARESDTRTGPTTGLDADAGAQEPQISCARPSGCPTDLPYCAPNDVCVQCLQDGACSAELPLCEPEQHRCVQCLTAEHCAAPTPHCDPKTHACAQCVSTLDCSDATAPSCQDGQCGACAGDDDCDHIPQHPLCDLEGVKGEGRGSCVECRTHADCKDPSKPQCTDRVCGPCQGKTADEACEGRRRTPVCDTAPGKTQGSCVQCTHDNERACGDFVCDVAKRSCSQERMGSAGTCRPCISDTQCMPDQRCIALSFDGEAHGSYCLKRLSTGCNEPYTITIRAPSLSFAEEDYCGINVRDTTCEAILAAIASTDCDEDDDCGAMMGDGQCRVVGGQADKCTYRCGTSAQCPNGLTCRDPQGYCN